MIARTGPVGKGRRLHPLRPRRKGSAIARAACLFAALALLALPSGPARAATVTIACGAVGIEYRLCREGAQAWAAARGHRVKLVQTPSLTNERLGLIQQMLSARSGAIDVFQIDVIWPGILGLHLIDLRPYFEPREIAAHYPRMIRNNTVGGELKAIPWFTDVGLLYYRKDLLERHGLAVPATWADLETAARRVLAAQRAAGNRRFAGFVFQGKAYEGLTCNALEWIAGGGGGQLLGPDGEITLNNPRAAAALRRVASWVGGIVPRGVLSYAEEEARGTFQSGNALFMRNWPYAWNLAQAPGSPVRGRVGVAPLPGGTATSQGTGTLGGWGLAVSKYSARPRLAASLVSYLTGRKEQTRRALNGGYNPTRPAIYDDPRLRAASPVFAVLARVLPRAVARPSRIAGLKYNRFSSIFWNAVHDALAGKTDAAQALAEAERRLRRVSRGGRW